jgi:hypothetical protein
METFGKRLHRTVAERGPLCVGIDPHAALLAGGACPTTSPAWNASPVRWSTPWPIGSPC